MATNAPQANPMASSQGRGTWIMVVGVLSTAVVAAWLLATVAHLPVPAIWLITAAVGWCLVGYAKASIAGICLWIVATVLLSIPLWSPVFGLDLLMPIVGLFLVGLLLSLSAGVALLIALVRRPSRSVGNCAGVILVVFTLINVVMARNTMTRHHAGPARVEQTRELVLALHQLTAEIETYRDQLGRLPKDEAELVSLRGQPMPPYFQDYRVNYYQRGEGDWRCVEDDYYLRCSAFHFWGRAGDIFGWGFCFYGPDCTQRLEVELF